MRTSDRLIISDDAIENFRDPRYYLLELVNEEEGTTTVVPYLIKDRDVIEADARHFFSDPEWFGYTVANLLEVNSNGHGRDPTERKVKTWKKRGGGYIAPAFSF